MAGYDQSIIDAILARGQQVSDPSARNRYIRAALQTGIVESGLQNLNHGDADSLGWRQERASLYPNPTNVNASVNRFFEEAAKLDRGQHSWELAADVQRPAEQYRGRYHDVASQAAQLLRQHGASAGGQAPSSPSTTTPDAGGAGFSFASSVPTLQPGQGGDYTSLLAGMLGGKQQQAPPMSSALPVPQFTSGLAQPHGFRPIESSGPPRQQATSADLSLLEGLRGSGTGVEPGQVTATAERPGVFEQVLAEREHGRKTGVVPLGGAKNKGHGSFEIDGPNPDRLKSELVKFADKVAAILGAPLVGADGSTHSKYTVNGNVSEHFTGNATDIFTIDGKPARGQVLLRAGRAALIAAGMPRAQALKAGGGLYNVGNHQIIFLTNEGGNHFDHLHISSHAR